MNIVASHTYAVFHIIQQFQPGIGLVVKRYKSINPIELWKRPEADCSIRTLSSETLNQRQDLQTTVFPNVPKDWRVVPSLSAARLGT